MYHKHFSLAVCGDSSRKRDFFGQNLINTKGEIFQTKGKVPFKCTAKNESGKACNAAPNPNWLAKEIERTPACNQALGALMPNQPLHFDRGDLLFADEEAQADKRDWSV